MQPRYKWLIASLLYAFISLAIASSFYSCATVPVYEVNDYRLYDKVVFNTKNDSILPCQMHQVWINEEYIRHRKPNSTYSRDYIGKWISNRFLKVEQVHQNDDDNPIPLLINDGTEYIEIQAGTIWFKGLVENEVKPILTLYEVNHYP